jgi:xylulose-5-phosphate/fructose-6-phosphate phosphoketolase
LDKETGAPNSSILELIPKEAEKRLGQRVESYKGWKKLDVPEWKECGLSVGKGEMTSCMEVVGGFLDLVIQR